MPPEVALLTTSEVARLFRVDSSTVRKWVETGKLRPAITTPGGHMRFNSSDVEAVMTRPAPDPEAVSP